MISSLTMIFFKIQFWCPVLKMLWQLFFTIAEISAGVKGLAIPTYLIITRSYIFWLLYRYIWLPTKQKCDISWFNAGCCTGSEPPTGQCKNCLASVSIPFERHIKHRATNPVLTPFRQGEQVLPWEEKPPVTSVR